MMAGRNRYKIAYKNYISVMWNIYIRKVKNKIKVIFHNENSTYLDPALAMNYAGLIANKNIHIDDLCSDSNNIKFIYNGKNVTLENGIGDVGVVFGNEDYNFLEVKDEIVIDIGPNIGDSPIYFGLNNAKKVIALEPYPYSYNKALKNIKNNNIEEKIILLNAGYGQDGITKVDPNFENTTGSDLKSFTVGIDIKTLSLKTLLNAYHIDMAVLKMDCEGCEYNLLKEDNDTLRKFKRIQIEYHYGYKKLKEKLEGAGFTVTYFNLMKRMGFIYAKSNV